MRDRECTHMIVFIVKYAHNVRVPGSCEAAGRIVLTRVEAVTWCKIFYFFCPKTFSWKRILREESNLKSLWITRVNEDNEETFPLKQLCCSFFSAIRMYTSETCKFVVNDTNNFDWKRRRFCQLCTGWCSTLHRVINGISQSV